MNHAVIPSTFLLTLLMSVGLFFFVRASVKDRTQVVKLLSDQPEEVLLTQLQQYFDGRAYRVTAVDQVKQQVTFEGNVRPSFFLAVFLTLLAAVGILCLTLMLSILLPNFAAGFIVLVALAPLAGLFYWRGAERLEQVVLKVEPTTRPGSAQTILTVAAHRDELSQLRRSLQLAPLDVA
jgi:uncharacterized membrane protein